MKMLPFVLELVAKRHKDIIIIISDYLEYES